MKQNKRDEWDEEDLRSYMKLPLKMKLRLLEEKKSFLDRFMSKKDKMIWNKLQQKGF